MFCEAVIFSPSFSRSIFFTPTLPVHFLSYRLLFFTASPPPLSTCFGSSLSHSCQPRHHSFPFPPDHLCLLSLWHRLTLRPLATSPLPRVFEAHRFAPFSSPSLFVSVCRLPSLAPHPPRLSPLSFPPLFTERSLSSCVCVCARALVEAHCHASEQVRGPGRGVWIDEAFTDRTGTASV